MMLHPTVMKNDAAWIRRAVSKETTRTKSYFSTDERTIYPTPIAGRN